MRLALALAGAFAWSTALAQEAPPRSTARFAYLDGQWVGPAWVIAPDGKRYDMIQTETVCPALGGEIRLMEGRGTIAGRQVFHAVTIIEGRRDGSVAMRSYTPGRTGDYRIEPVEGGFRWTIDAGEQEYRYDAQIKDDLWVETGEVRRKGSEAWTPMFRMDLTRQKDRKAVSNAFCG